MTHAWCSDPSRDAAVRAAEDGRTGPLPTLEECIGMLPKSDSPSSAPEHENKGESMGTKRDKQAADYRAEASERAAPSGLRTERVTLEVTCRSKPAEWCWPEILRKWGISEQVSESVRVVDEPSSEADAEVLRRALATSDIRRLKAEAVLRRALATSDIRRLKAEAERDALRACFAEGPKLAPHANAVGGSNHAAQAASGGGEPQCVSSGSCGATTGDSGQDWHLASIGREPVAWLCEWTDHTSLHQSKCEAERAADGDVVPQPLYRSTKPELPTG